MNILIKTKIKNLISLRWNVLEGDEKFDMVEVHVNTNKKQIRVIADHPTPGVGPIDLGYGFDDYTEVLENILYLVISNQVEYVECFLD